MNFPSAPKSFRQRHDPKHPHQTWTVREKNPIFRSKPNNSKTRVCNPEKQIPNPLQRTCYHHAQRIVFVSQKEKKKKKKKTERERMERKFQKKNLPAITRKYSPKTPSPEPLQFLLSSFLFFLFFSFPATSQGRFESLKSEKMRKGRIPAQTEVTWYKTLLKLEVPHLPQTQRLTPWALDRTWRAA